MNKAGLITVIIVCSLLGGCERDRKEELNTFIEVTKANSIGSIEPLPEVKPYETFTYNAFDLRSPFMQPPQKETVMALPSNNGIAPDVHRRKEILESYPLDALRMVGTLEKEEGIWAIVIDSDGAVHRIKAGNYVGQNHGKIDKVTEEKVFVTEIIPDAAGGWQERDAQMTLVE